MADMPKNYDAPEWTQLSASAEKKVGIPEGLLQAIVNHGEKSNTDQVSEKGARTVYQITPPTAKLIEKKYGIDPYLSPENAALGAAYLLKESLDRNGGKTALAVAEYHGGVDRSNWKSKTNKYVMNVLRGLSDMRSSAPNIGGRLPDAKTKEQSSFGDVSNIFTAYKNGKMTRQEANDFEADVKAGKIDLPPGAKLGIVSAVDNSAPVLPTEIADAYVQGKMTDQEKFDLESDVKEGKVRMPDGYGSIDTNQSNKTIESVRSFGRGATMGLSDVYGSALAAGAAAATSDVSFPEAYVDIKDAVSAQRDQFRRENPALAYGTEIAGGLAPAVITGGASVLPQAETLAGRAALGAGIGAAQGGVYGATQAQTGEAAPDLVKGALVGGAIGGALPLAGQAVKSGWQALRGGSPAAAAVENAVEDVAQQADNVRPPVPQFEPVQMQVSAPIGSHAAADVAEGRKTSFADLAKTIKSGGQNSAAALREWTSRAQYDAEAMRAAEKMGIDLPLDAFVDDPLLRNAAGLARSNITSAPRIEWDVKHADAMAAAENALQKLDAAPSLATASDDVLRSLKGTRAGIKEAESELHGKIQQAMPPPTNVTMERTAQVVNDAVDNLGAEADASLIKLLDSATNPETSYAALKQIKSKLGQQIETKGLKEPFGNTELRLLRQIYKAVAQDEADNVERIGGAELRADLSRANRMTQTRKLLERRIVSAYGREGSGSIASKLSEALNSGAKKADITKLNGIIATIPDDMRAKTLMSAILHNTRNAKNTGVSFEKYETLYSGIMQHPEIAKAVMKDMSKDQREGLRALYVLSKRVNKMNTAIKHTGIGLQGVVENIGLNNVLDKMMAGEVTGKATKAASMYIPFGDKALNFLQEAPEQKLAKFNAVITSAEFADLAKAALKAEADGSEVPAEIVQKISRSEQFRKFASTIKIPNNNGAREAFILSALQPEAENQ